MKVNNTSMKKTILLAVVVIILPRIAAAQIPSKESILEEGMQATAFQKKFRAGISMNIYWSSVVGTDLPEEYFWKPSLGGIPTVRYNFKEWIGLSAGVGFQQSGGGIINQDISGGAFSHPWIVNKFGVRGDPDSTHLEKLRFNNIDVPVLLEVRLPKDVIQPGWRPSAVVGADFMFTQKVNKIWQSIVDGFHDDHYVTENYIKKDVGIMAGLGMDIDTGTGQMLQIQFMWMKGLNNIYKVDSGDGHNSYRGVRFVYYF
jgi:hypothetical protein